MAVSAADVKKLRDATGVGMMDAKKALDQANGDFDMAVDALRKAGAAKAAKKADRTAVEGVVVSYIHPGSQIGVLLELNSETDFVGRNEQFQVLANDLALHIAASNPLYIRREDVSEEVVAKEKEIIAEQLKAAGKPADKVDQIVEGKLNKWYEEVVLFDQPYVKDDKKTVGALLQESIQTIGENIQISRFARFTIKGNPSCQLDTPQQ